MHGLFVWMMETLNAMGYGGILFLMVLESSIVPIPSELIVPPAAYWASQGTMSLPIVLLVATCGSWLGSAANYWISRAIGRPLIVRYGRYVLVDEQHVEMAERWVQKYGVAGIFFSRLLPVVRHLISIPAGILSMDFASFSLMTVMGAGLWACVLAWFGPRVITPEMLHSSNPDVILHAVKGQMHYIVLLVVLVTVLYGVMQAMARKKK